MSLPPMSVRGSGIRGGRGRWSSQPVHREPGFPAVSPPVPLDSALAIGDSRNLWSAPLELCARSCSNSCRRDRGVEACWCWQPTDTNSRNSPQISGIDRENPPIMYVRLIVCGFSVPDAKTTLCLL